MRKYERKIVELNTDYYPEMYSFFGAKLLIAGAVRADSNDHFMQKLYF